MLAVRAKYKDGKLTLVESGPPQRDECEVLVLFPEAGISAAPKRIELRPVPASHLQELEGIASVGGNALEDCERLYE